MCALVRFIIVVLTLGSLGVEWIESFRWTSWGDGGATGLDIGCLVLHTVRLDQGQMGLRCRGAEGEEDEDEGSMS